MASGNRVEELENRVRELEATVSGLTDELVETKERLRTLEEEVDPDVDAGGDIIAPEPTSTGPSSTGTSTNTNEGEASDAKAEGAKATEDNDDDNSDSELSDDIIVA